MKMSGRIDLHQLSVQFLRVKITLIEQLSDSNSVSDEIEVVGCGPEIKIDHRFRGLRMVQKSD